jgi:hypothetical protein
MIAFAQAHPQDPRVPEALYLVVRATRYGCEDNQTGDFSHRAFDLLHRRYAATEWAAKTPCWFKIGGDGACPLLFFGFPDDVNLLARMHELQPLADFLLLLGCVVGETFDVLPSLLDVTRQCGVALFRFLDLALPIEQTGYALRTA